jgi:hypothetical protein
MFANRVLSSIYGCKRDEITDLEKCIMRSFIIYTIHHQIKKAAVDRSCNIHGRDENCV